MSGKILGQVWDYKLTRTQAWVLMALADHADHFGENAYPSTALIAWKTSLDERTVRRALSELRRMRAIIPMRQSRHHHPTTYRIVFSSLERKPPYIRPNRGDPLSPHESAAGGTPVSSSGGENDRRADTAVPPKPSSRTVKETPADFQSEGDASPEAVALVMRQLGRTLGRMP